MSKFLILLALLAQEEARPRSALADLPADGTLAVAGQAVPWKDVAAALKRHAESGVRQLVLRVDGAVPFSSVQNLMAAAREAGLEGVQFSADKPVAPVRFSQEARRSIRIKLREGAKGLELLILQESSAVSLDDLRKKLKAIEKGPVVVDAEVEVPYAAVQQIIAACTEEGFDKVSFAGSTRKTGAIRVLYLEGTPRAEFRYLRNLLERSPDFRLDFLLDPMDPSYPDGLSSYPRDLSAYDVVIVGSVADLYDPGKRALVEWVTRSGGGIVWLSPEDLKEKWLGNGMKPICPVGLKRGGPDAMTLAVKQPDAPILTALDWTPAAGKLMTGWSTHEVDQDARVLVEGRDRPGDKAHAFLVTAEAGKGRAAFVGASNTHSLREGTGDRPLYAPFWTNVLKWAAGR